MSLFDHTFEGTRMVELAIAEGHTLEMCQYRYFGSYSQWRKVDAERAMHKARITVQTEDGYFHPYHFRVATA